MKPTTKLPFFISAVLLLNVFSVYAQLNLFIPGTTQDKEKNKQQENKKDTSSTEKVTNISSMFGSTSNAYEEKYKNEHKISNSREIHYQVSKKYLLAQETADDNTGSGNMEKPAANNKTYNADASKSPPINTTKYRRSSLYTMVVKNDAKPYNISMINGFGNATQNLPEKFNNHDLGPYYIQVANGNNIPTQIENYLNSNNVAKLLIAKWFRRTANGTFDMKLVADRGEYDASYLDEAIAMKTVRGRAMLLDAGEELIGKTFVIVYDIDFIDKGSTYQIGMNCYLYKLVWDDASANIFYNNYWADRKKPDPARKLAFDNSSDFKMQYVGNVAMQSDLKPYPHKMKDSYLQVSYDVEYKTIPAMLKNSWVKLEEAFEEFRLRFPLYSADPIAAKIGAKEGVKAGDKFEVIEKILNADGTFKYKRLGIISIVDSNKIWDNNTIGDWLGTTTNKLEYTTFEGEKGKYAPGMLFRKIYQ